MLSSRIIINTYTIKKGIQIHLNEHIAPYDYVIVLLDYHIIRQCDGSIPGCSAMDEYVAFAALDPKDQNMFMRNCPLLTTKMEPKYMWEYTPGVHQPEMENVAEVFLSNYIHTGTLLKPLVLMGMGISGSGKTH